MDKGSVLPLRIVQLAQEAPNMPFIWEADSGAMVTRSEFDELARRWAAALCELGVCAGRTVLTMVPTTVDAAAIWMGTAWLRALETPVNTDYRGQLLRYMLEDSGAHVAVIHARFRERFTEVWSDFPTLKHVVVVGEEAQSAEGSCSDEGPSVISAADLLARVEPAIALAPPRPSDTAAIIYTSGTTGPSKGVIVPWAQLHTSVVWTPPIDDLACGGVGYAPFPFYHTAPRAFLYRMALAGGQLVLRQRLSVSNFWPDVKRFGCTYSQLLGSMARMLIQAPESPDDADNTLQFSTMLPLLPDVEDFEKRFGLRTGTLFTMTETSVPLVTQADYRWDTDSCGTVRPGCDVRLVDEDDYEVPVGQVGELIVRTDEPWTLNAGYWKKSAETAKAWRNGWFHTGDAFRRDEHGNYYFVDRYKDAIRRRGENISSIEVETLIQQHPDVVDVAVIGVPSPLEEDDVMAVVVRRKDSDLTAPQLIDFLRASTPAFMVPRYVDFADELPKTPTQKTKKSVLRKAGVTATTYDAAKKEAPA